LDFRIDVSFFPYLEQNSDKLKTEINSIINEMKMLNPSSSYIETLKANLAINLKEPKFKVVSY